MEGWRAKGQRTVRMLSDRLGQAPMERSRKRPAQLLPSLLVVASRKQEGRGEEENHKMIMWSYNPGLVSESFLVLHVAGFSSQLP